MSCVVSGCGMGRASWGVLHLDATSDLKHLAGDVSSLGKAIGSHRGDGAAWLRWLQIDCHRTGTRFLIVLIIAAHRVAAGMHARRHRRGQERR